MADYKDVLLINENVIKSVTNISENVSGGYILPAIKLAQDIDLEETIGSPLKIALQQKVFNNEIGSDLLYKTLLDDYIQQYLIYATIVHLIPNIAYKITNAGVMITEDEKMTNTSDIDKVKWHYKHLSDVYKNRLQRHLIANYSNYPELGKYKTVEDIRQNLYSSASSGLNLGGARGKRC